MTHKALSIAAGAALVALLAVAGNEDAAEAERQADKCQRMAELWEDTGGEYGWPPETCQ